MTIKRIQKSDQDLMEDLLVHHIDVADAAAPPTLEHLQQLVSDETTYLYAAVLDGRVVGYVLAYRFPSLYATKNMAYLYDIDVQPNQQRKGIGRKLIEMLKHQLTMDEVHELWLGTAIDNFPAQALFAATGAAKSTETFFDYTYNLLK